MVSFELGKAIEKKFFFSVLSRAWDKEKILSPLRNRTSDLRIPRSDAQTTKPQRLHDEREIIVFPDYQNLPAEFAINSRYFYI